MRLRSAYPLLGLLMLAACSSTPEPKKEAEPAPTPAPTPVEPEPPRASAVPSKVGAPEVFKVKMDTSKGPVIIEVHREWAPLGADRFYELVKDGFFTEARFFRIVPNFIVQFGLAADPKMSKKWDKPITDDPVSRTNRPGSVTFATAGPNTRTTQLFINTVDNSRLDPMGFGALGEVVDGMSVVDALYSGYGEGRNEERPTAKGPEQARILEEGNAYLAEFPKLDYILKATILK